MHWGLFQDATVTTMLQVATLMQQCMRQQVKSVVACVMVACTTQWAETVNSVNHSSIKTQREKWQTQKFVSVSHIIKSYITVYCINRILQKKYNLYHFFICTLCFAVPLRGTRCVEMNNLCKQNVLRRCMGSLRCSSVSCFVIFFIYGVSPPLHLLIRDVATTCGVLKFEMFTWNFITDTFQWIPLFTSRLEKEKMYTYP